jgi:hypothetical protein
MQRNWISIGVVGLLLGIYLATLGLATRESSAADPSPEEVAEQFFQALDQHDFEAAQATLSAEQRASLNAEALQGLAVALEQAGRGAIEAHSVASQVDSQQVAATVMVQLGATAPVALPLRQEDGAWRITSVEPVQQLTAD